MLPPPNFALGKRTCLLLAVLLATTLHGLGASKVRSEKPTKVEEGFKPFAIISERNVFNANREGDATAAPAAPAPKPTRPPKVEAFALLGTLISERGSVAFFDGTSTAYRRAVELGDQLGSHTVAAIEHDRVTLREGERELCLPLKMQFRREGEGEWLLAALPDDFQPTAPPPGQIFAHRKPDPRSLTPEQIRDYVMNKNERKLAQLAENPEKAEKLLRALDKEIEGRVRKLDKNLSKTDRKMQQTAP
jgi:Tfp pilus assembly protein PilP